ncbi:MAG TPA: Holliday junction branch migration protein RuvA [Candidatus Paceibacterota bacterium]|nr:Holliday junction branch migration protein RuvA [Candidatus Paceibacterota bacterium]
MIALIKGIVTDKEDRGIIVDTGSIGYFVSVPEHTKEVLAVGEQVTLVTHLVIRDDSHDLYGFESKPERELFLMLFSVSGVGPRTALHILSSFPLPRLISTIQNGSGKELSLVPGIGKKTGEKIVLELKEKMKLFAPEITASEVNHDVYEALVALGYKDYKIHEALQGINKDISTQAQIKEALQILGK